VFTGGALSGELVPFDLVNDGGVIAPATGPKLMYIAGDLTMNAGDFRRSRSRQQVGSDDPGDDRCAPPAVECRHG
jgi:hypothetical protein